MCVCVCVSLCIVVLAQNPQAFMSTVEKGVGAV